MIQQRNHSSGWRRLWPLVSVVLLLFSVLPVGDVCAGGRDHPFRIGVLTASWGPTPQTVGIRDGLLALGYRENEDFVSCKEEDYVATKNRLNCRRSAVDRPVFDV